MAFCKKCGAYIAEGCSACPACGWSASSSFSGGSATAQAAQSAPEPEKDQSEQQRSQQNEQSGSGQTGQQQNTGTYNYNYNYDSGRNRDRSRQRSSSRYSSQSRSESNSSRFSGSAEDYNSQHDGRGGWAPADDRYADPYDARSNRGIACLCYFGLLFLVPYFLRPNSEFVRFHCNQGLLMLLFAGAVSVASAMPVLGWLVGVAGWILTVVMFFRGIHNVRRGIMGELPIIGKIRLLK